MADLGRRSFITGLGAALIAAPAIVRAGSLMPVRNMLITDFTTENMIVKCTEVHRFMVTIIIDGEEMVIGKWVQLP